MLNHSNSSNNNNSNYYCRNQQPQYPQNYHQNFYRPQSEQIYPNPLTPTDPCGFYSRVPDRARSTSSASLNHEMNSKPVVAIVYLVPSPSTFSTATLGRMTQNLRSRHRHSSGSSLNDTRCRMNKSSSLGTQSYPYGSPLHSYVSSQDLFSSQLQGRRRSSSVNSSQQLLLPTPGSGQQQRFESPIGFDLKAETEQLMNRTQKLLVRGREVEKTEVDEWVI